MVNTKKLNPSQMQLLLKEQATAEAKKKKWVYTQPCIYCNQELALNSLGEEIGFHDCKVGRDIWAKMKIDDRLNNRQHNMLVHGFLMAVQMYAASFGLESTAAIIIKDSGISKVDFIRCQIESGYRSDIILPLIEKAFLIKEL